MNGPTLAHFPQKSFAQRRNAWQESFRHVSTQTQRRFNTTTRQYRIITSNPNVGADNIVLPSR